MCYFQYGRYIRCALRQEKALSAIADLLTNEHERVVKAASGALRNLAVDARNKELIGEEQDVSHYLSVQYSALIQQVLNNLFIEMIERKDPSPPQFVNARVGEAYTVELEHHGVLTPI